MGIKRRNRKHNSAAIYGHFTGAKRLPGKAEGNITVFWFDHGWFWFIPLADGTTSVGAVCWPYYMKTRKTSPEQFFLDTVAPARRSPSGSRCEAYRAGYGHRQLFVRRQPHHGAQLPDARRRIYLHRPGVFHRRAACHAKRFVGADTIETCLDRPAQAGAALKRFDAMMRRGPGIFSWLIYRVTTPAIRALFMAPSNRFRVQEALDLRACGRYLPAHALACSHAPLPVHLLREKPLACARACLSASPAVHSVHRLDTDHTV